MNSEDIKLMLNPLPQIHASNTPLLYLFDIRLIYVRNIINK